MKKLLSLMLSAVMLLSFAACSNDEVTTTEKTKAGDSMSLKEIMDEIEKDVSDLPQTMQIVPTDENFSAFIFIDPIDGAEALASDAAINAVSHSAVLLRVPEGTDVDEVATSISENANPRKWICTEADKVDVSLHGNTILLVMSTEETVNDMIANFDNLWV